MNIGLINDRDILGTAIIPLQNLNIIFLDLSGLFLNMLVRIGNRICKKPAPLVITDEIIGGSERESRLDVLKARMAELGLDEKDYWWYLELRKYGSVPHAGFGLGFERAVQYVTGMQNIRDVIPYPRAAKQADF